MSISPTYWGAELWKVLFSIGSTFPQTAPTSNQQNAVISFFNSLRELLPCESCREHYQAFIQTNPIAVATQSQAALLDWIHKLNTEISNGLGKPVRPLAQILKEIEPYTETPKVLPPPEAPKELPVAPAVIAPPTAIKTAPAQLSKIATLPLRNLPKSDNARGLPRKGGCNCGGR